MSSVLKMMKAVLAWRLKFITSWRIAGVSGSGESGGRWEDEGDIDIKE